MRAYHLLGVVALSVVFLLASPAQAGEPIQLVKPEKAGMSSERLARLGHAMQGYVDRGELAGTVTLIARHGKVVHFEAHGDQYAEEQVPMTRDSIFRIASMTKPITSVALMMLYEEGKFQLDDPISKWFPEYANMQVAIKAPSDERVALPYKLVPANGPITVRHILTHTSGLANTYRGYTRELLSEAGLVDGERAETVDESFVRTAKVPLNFHPGDEWEYGAATSMCGVMVERITGMTLDEFFKARIFEPLGMRDTHFNIPESKTHRVAALYRPDADGKFELAAAPAYREPNRYFSGAGGLASTAHDYFRFHQMMLNGGVLEGARILSPKTIELMITNHIGDMQVWLKGPGYGFGLGYSILLDSGKASEALSPGSFGWGGAFNTYFWVNPEEDMLGIFMSQIRPYTHLNVRADLSSLAMQAIIQRNPNPPTIMGRKAID